MALLRTDSYGGGTMPREGEEDPKTFDNRER